MTAGYNIKTHLARMGLDTDAGQWRQKIDAVSADDVRQALEQQTGLYDIQRLIRLLSPAAQAFLEPMAQTAQKLTIQRFGRTIQLFAPLYLSNVCINSCIYCGYNRTNKFTRTQLTLPQALADAAVIADEGFRHILLVSGEDREFVSERYLRDLAAKLKDRFASITVEIYPMTQKEYQNLFFAGVEGVTLYQETYNRTRYTACHPAGPKSDYDWRLDAPDRFASAGMRQIGLGVLLGLSDWRIETLALAEHAHYLMKHYWRSAISFSFPRLRPACNVQDAAFLPIADKEMVQMMLALRLCFPDAGIVLSTREGAAFRDAMTNLCITRMSAGSKTNPGGYTDQGQSEQQFEVADDRSPFEVAQMIRSLGREPVWKDSDTALKE